MQLPRPLMYFFDVAIAWQDGLALEFQVLKLFMRGIIINAIAWMSIFSLVLMFSQMLTNC